MIKTIKVIAWILVIFNLWVVDVFPYTHPEYITADPILEQIKMLFRYDNFLMGFIYSVFYITGSHCLAIFGGIAIMVANAYTRKK